MKFILFFLLTSVVISCSHKFHGDARLFGEWHPLTRGLPNIYFDNTHYFFMDLDTTKKTAYGLFYRVDNDIITIKSKGIIYNVNVILKISQDTLILQDEKIRDIVCYVRRKRD